jgi:UrcA family protein
MTNIKHIALATVAALAIGTAAQAEDLTQPTINVDTSRVDFASAASVDQLRDRVARAARRVCQVGKSRELSQQAKARECLSQTVAAANSQITHQMALSGSVNGGSVAVSAISIK